MKKAIKPFKVMVWDFNKNTMIPYDIMPYLIREYKDLKPKDRPTSYLDFYSFIETESLHQWWSRCEYEMLISGWPKGDKEIKTDVYQQVKMNLSIITDIFMENVL